jgi:hypothetical protein
MGNNKIWYFINEDFTMMYMQQFHNDEGRKATMRGCSVQVEQLEMDNIKVTFASGAVKYFELRSPYTKSLRMIREAVHADVTGFDKFDLYIQCEEVYHE